MQDDIEIGRAEAKESADFIRLDLVGFAHGNNLRGPGGKLFQAIRESIPKLFALEQAIGVIRPFLPGRCFWFPMPVDQEFVARRSIAWLFGGKHRFTDRFPVVIHDLVFHDSDHPPTLDRFVDVAGGRLQGCQQRVLDEILGNMRISDAPEGKPVKEIP